MLDKSPKFSRLLMYLYIYMISADPLMMVSHTPNHKKLRKSDESNQITAQYMGSASDLETLKSNFFEAEELTFQF